MEISNSWFVEALEEAIKKPFRNLDQEIINKDTDNWMRRLNAVIAVKGEYFE